jgi:ankyrin repeat protein
VWLVSSGKPMTTNLSGQLFEAIVLHDLERARSLLSQGADPNAPKANGWRPLHTALGQIDGGGSIEFVKLLLEHGADPNAWDANHHETPILSASDPLDVENLEGAQVLLEAGADPNARRSDGESPLRMAARWKSLPLAELLLKHGADKTIDEFGGDWAWTALGHAAHNFDVNMIQVLLGAGADPEATDDTGLTASDRLPPRETQDPAVWDQVIGLLAHRRP